MKVESFIGLMQVNHLLVQQLIQILVLQHFLSQNGWLQKHGDQKLVETPNKFAIFFFYVKFSDFRSGTWFISILTFGLPRVSFKVFWIKTETELFWAISVSSKRNIKSNDFERLLSRQTCRRNCASLSSIQRPVRQVSIIKS